MKAPDYHGCLTGDCPHEKQAECFDALYTLGFSDATAKVKPALHIAYEDTGDQYYKNVEDDLDKAIGAT